MKQYPIICPSCKGNGMIKNPSLSQSTASPFTIPCPACNGSGSVICQETEGGLK